MKKALLSFAALSMLAASAFAGKDGTWSGSTTHQFFPTIVQALLGNGYALIPSQAFFGDCSDGNVTISSGTTSLARDMFYNNLTINGTGKLDMQNQRVFVCGTLDLTAAPAGAIVDDSLTAKDGVAGTAAGGAGGGGNAVAAGTNIASQAGGNGGAGGTAAGTIGSVGLGGNCITGEQAGASGAGGLGASGAGGGGRAAPTPIDFYMRDILHWYLPQTGAGAAIKTSGAAPGGGGGGGDGTAGGGGGGGGSSGATIYLSAFKISTGVSTLSGTITANGGNGGNGGSPAAGNRGGGGGGGGGAGGWVVIKYNTKVGSAVTNLVQALGGAHGNGGTKTGTGVNGSSGSDGTAGMIQILNMATGLTTTSFAGGVNL